VVGRLSDPVHGDAGRVPGRLSSHNRHIIARAQRIWQQVRLALLAHFSSQRDDAAFEVRE
jgi:hypothetical protein